MMLTNMLGFEPDRRADRAPRAWPKYMTARVAADYADSSPWTIRRHVRPCGRRGRLFVYSIESIDAWMRGEAIAAKRNDAAAAPSKPRASAPKATGLTRIRELATTHAGDRPHVEPNKAGVAA